MRLRAACLISLSLALAVPVLANAAPLKLRAHEIGLVDGVRTFDQRYVVYKPAPGVLRVVDDRTDVRHDQAVPTGCVPLTVEFPEALLRCRDPEGQRPLIVDARTGAFTELERGSGDPSARGYFAPADDYSLLGRQWIAGSYHDLAVPLRPERVYLNRITGERRQVGYADPLLDLDSPSLAPLPRQRPACTGPGRQLVDPAARRWLRRGGRRMQSLVLARCGARSRLVYERCRDYCGEPIVVGGVVAWPSNGRVTIHALRSRRRAIVRFPRQQSSPYGISLTATNQRLLIMVRRPYSPHTGQTYRLLEVRLPAHLR